MFDSLLSLLSKEKIEEIERASIENCLRSLVFSEDFAEDEKHPLLKCANPQCPFSARVNLDNHLGYCGLIHRGVEYYSVILDGQKELAMKVYPALIEAYKRFRLKGRNPE